MEKKGLERSSGWRKGRARWGHIRDESIVDCLKGARSGLSPGL
jgi:hypothetical protein